VVNIAAFAFPNPFTVTAAIGYDLVIVGEIRETCIGQTYGPGYF